jgi:hypothetical protein
MATHKSTRREANPSPRRSTALIKSDNGTRYRELHALRSGEEPVPLPTCPSSPATPQLPHGRAGSALCTIRGCSLAGASG